MEGYKAQLVRRAKAVPLQSRGITALTPVATICLLNTTVHGATSYAWARCGFHPPSSMFLVFLPGTPQGVLTFKAGQLGDLQVVTTSETIVSLTGKVRHTPRQGHTHWPTRHQLNDSVFTAWLPSSSTP